MYRQYMELEPRQRSAHRLLTSKSDLSWNDWDQWDQLEPAAARSELWDVFLLDEETAEPEPQQGDFWGEPDNEELI